MDKCKAILESYLTSLRQCGKNQEEIKRCVMKTILNFNILNEELDYSLIETEEREALCSFILKAARKAGLLDQSDITETWREW